MPTAFFCNNCTKFLDIYVQHECVFSNLFDWWHNLLLWNNTAKPNNL